jgi:hypothetical protein
MGSSIVKDKDKDFEIENHRLRFNVLHDICFELQMKCACVSPTNRLKKKLA